MFIVELSMWSIHIHINQLVSRIALLRISSIKPKCNILVNLAKTITSDKNQKIPNMDDILKELELSNQGHILKFYSDLNDEQKSQLESDIRQVDWETFSKVYVEQVLPHTGGGSKVKPASKIDDDLIEELPLSCIQGTARCDEATKEKYRTEGLNSIKDGKVAALLLAGGQGTRLGVDYPKGMYDIGLPSHKSLFQLQAERISKLINLTISGDEEKSKIIWYIMTSEATMEKTRGFFKDHDFFGLNEDNVVFFEQQTIPSLAFDGKVLLAEKYRLSRSPDGNGGLYEALHKKGIIEHMITHGVEYVHAYCVDNVLVRVCDPTFMGYCITQQVEVGCKVVEKVFPNESVGIICKVQGQFKVIEYSEISETIANKRDDATGKLAFNAGNICEHFFTVEFLKMIQKQMALPYHLAIKKIPCISLETGELIKPGEPNGIKLEKFIFDVFAYTQKFSVWEVNREDEFSPLKNAIGSEKDNPTTALAALLRAYEKGILSN